MISFSTATAKRTVIGAMILVGVVTIVRDVSEQQTPDVPKLLIGTLLGAILLTLLAEAIPELAGMLAVLVLVATLLQSGAPALKAVTARVAKNPTPKPRTVLA